MQLTDKKEIAMLENTFFAIPYFSKKLCILAVISPLGNVANAIFIIISGYFMAHKTFIDLTKISKKLLVQLGFASVCLGLASIYAYHFMTEKPMRFVTFNSFNEICWFVGYYFIVIVFAKVFLNRFLSKLEKKDYVMFMIVLFALVQFAYSTSIIIKLGDGLERVCTGIFLYSLGGYVKKYEPFKSIRLWVIFAIIIAMNLIIIGNFYIITAKNIIGFDPESSDMFLQSIPSYKNNQFVPIILAIAIFELFRRMKLPNNRIINFVGGSTFMIYLIHDNEFVRKI